MTKKNIRERLFFLFIVLQFSDQKKELLKVGERILINQERGSLLYKLDFSQAEIRSVPESIENKIKEIDRLIQVYNYSPLNLDPFKDESEY